MYLIFGEASKFVTQLNSVPYLRIHHYTQIEKLGNEGKSGELFVKYFSRLQYFSFRAYSQYVLILTVRGDYLARSVPLCVNSQRGCTP